MDHDHPPGETCPLCQRELLPAVPEAPAVFFERLESTTGDYTAERLRSKRPEDYKIVMALLARGWGSQKIQDEFHRLDKKLSKNTVKAVRSIEGETIDLLRTRLAGEAFVAADDYRHAAVTVLEEIMSDPHRRKKMTIRDVQSLEVSSGIATQNGQLLAGLPTARLELKDLRTPDHDDFNRMLKTLPTVEVAPPTHSMGGTRGEKEGVAGDAGTASTATTPGAAAGPPPATGADSQSGDPETKDQ